MNLFEECTDCQGTGMLGPFEDHHGVPLFVLCHRCGGQGVVPAPPPDEDAPDEEKDTWARRFWRALFGKQED